MTEVKADLLLNSHEMAQFCVDGFLYCENLVPQELNEAVYYDELHVQPQGYDFWFHSEALRKVFELPRVKGIIQSLVGPDSVYNHSYLHTVPTGKLKTQYWHIDSGVMNVNPHDFDIQAFYFAHDTPLEMGPTLVLPGSHLRRASYWTISRYKNIVGQRHLVAKAGTIVFMHQDIWHCAQGNQTDKTRYVFKIRLDPRVKQQNLFNKEGYDSPGVLAILNQRHQWTGGEWYKESQRKIDFWRSLVGDDSIGRRLHRYSSSQ